MPPQRPRLTGRPVVITGVAGASGIVGLPGTGLRAVTVISRLRSAARTPRTETVR